MIRTSERELARAVDDFSGDRDMVFAWAERYLAQTVAEQGFELEFALPTNDDASTVTVRNRSVVEASDEECIPVLESDYGTFFAPRSDVPAWIDVEELPVKAGA